MAQKTLREKEKMLVISIFSFSHNVFLSLCCRGSFIFGLYRKGLKVKFYFRGPEGTYFEGGVFPARLTFPPDYPLGPPKMKFMCELFHPNSKFKLQLFPKQQILDSPKLKELADDNFKVNENTRKSSNWYKTLWVKEKLLVTSNFSLSQSVLK